jgi:hypothetical protein
LREKNSDKIPVEDMDYSEDSDGEIHEDSDTHEGGDIHGDNDTHEGGDIHEDSNTDKNSSPQKGYENLDRGGTERLVNFEIDGVQHSSTVAENIPCKGEKDKEQKLQHNQSAIFCPGATIGNRFIGNIFKERLNPTPDNSKVTGYNEDNEFAEDIEELIFGKSRRRSLIPLKQIEENATTDPVPTSQEYSDTHESDNIHEDSDTDENSSPREDYENLDKGCTECLVNFEIDGVQHSSTVAENIPCEGEEDKE